MPRPRPPLLAFTAGAPLAALLVACAASPATTPDEPLIAEAGPRPLPARRAQSPATRLDEPPPPPLPTGPVGHIPRAALADVLRGSPGAFLARVDAEPVLVGRRFVGWRIRALFAGDARFVASALRRGDVVTGVNGMPVERPEQFEAAWRALGTAQALSVAVVRAGRSGTLTWLIDDGPPAR